MKKVLLGIIISSLVSVAASAQSKLSLGPSAGIGSSWISNSGDSKSKLSGNVGLSLVYSAAEHFGIGLDGKYSFEGGKSTSGNQTTTADLNYIRVPLKAIYFFGRYGSKVRPKIFVGPSFGFLAGGDTKVERDNVVLGTIKSKDVYQSFDFGVTAGAGLNIRLVKNTWLNADVSYLHGISDVIKNTDLHNRNIGVNIGVNFGL
jgi:outer membrane protein W